MMKLKRKKRSTKQLIIQNENMITRSAPGVINQKKQLVISSRRCFIEINNRPARKCIYTG